MKRRDFLKSSLTAAAVAGIAPAQLFAEQNEALSQANFATLEGIRMRVVGDDDRASLQLSEVRPLGSDRRFEQFELVLEGPAGLGEGLFTVVPEKGPRLRFHISPAGTGRYVAVFNRRRN